VTAGARTGMPGFASSPSVIREADKGAARYAGTALLVIDVALVRWLLALRGAGSR
jgi:hypothetical protein